MIHEDFISYVSDLRNKDDGNGEHVMVLLVDSGLCPENHRIEIDSQPAHHLWHYQD